MEQSIESLVNFLEFLFSCFFSSVFLLLVLLRHLHLQLAGDICLYTKAKERRKWAEPHHNKIRMDALFDLLQEEKRES